ncbi:MAG: Pycsar system effector family protein [Acidimicrobiia bacterium]
MKEPADAGMTATIYMLRTTQQHHVQLSAMADIKANILITASSILLSVTIALLPTEGFRPSLALLATGVLVGLFFAVLAVVPKFGRPKPADHRMNLLSFGSFAHIPEDDFIAALTELSKDADRVFAAQARDIHQLGSYLESSKYRWLRLAYLAFLAGLVGGGIVELAQLLR